MGRPTLHYGCKVEGCAGDHAGLGFCLKHYTRFRKHGDAHTVLPRGPKPIRSDGNISYVGAHQRVRARRGKASAGACEDCGSAAQDWALSREAEDTLEGVTSRGRPARYSLDPEDYRRMCRNCHYSYDREVICA